MILNLHMHRYDDSNAISQVITTSYVRLAEDIPIMKQLFRF